MGLKSTVPSDFRPHLQPVSARSTHRPTHPTLASPTMPLPSASEHTNPYSTRSTNASAHPGLPDQKRKKRSMADVAAEREAKALDLEKKEAEHAALLARIAELEAAASTANGSQSVPPPTFAQLTPAAVIQNGLPGMPTAVLVEPHVGAANGNKAAKVRAKTIRADVQVLRAATEAQVGEPAETSAKKRKSSASQKQEYVY